MNSPDSPLNPRQYIDLLGRNYGGQALTCSDDFFASKDNLLLPGAPVFIEDKYTVNGKWMDGWESRRRRGPGHDWCVLRLGLTGVIRAVNIDTTHFRGNAPAAITLQACNRDTDPDKDTIWQDILTATPVKPNCENIVAVDSTQPWSHLKLHIHPDGGVARLRVYGEVTVDWSRLLPGELVDLAACQYGGRAVACSDMFFGSMHNLLAPGRGVNMGDGWETRRRRDMGHDWVIIQLGTTGNVQRVEVDTCHFKGNYPDRISLEGILTKTTDLTAPGLQWTPLLPELHLGADRIHRYQTEILDSAKTFSHIRLNNYPDGGISRLRVFGYPGFTKTDAVQQP